MSVSLARNLAIIALVALAIVVVPGGGTAADAVVAVISLAFLAVMAWFARRLYMENRMKLWALTTAHRALLYGGFAVAFMTLVATARLWDSGAGKLAWLVLLAASAAAVYYVWAESRRYRI
jgi:hypothetical protein